MKRAGLVVSWLIPVILGFSGIPVQGTDIPNQGKWRVGGADNVMAFRSSLGPIFRKAASEFDVPVELLMAIAYVETRWSSANDLDSQDGAPHSYGIMGLRCDEYFGHSLDEAAGLINEERSALINDPEQCIRGAAALMRSYANEKAKQGELISDKIDTWQSVVINYCGIPQPDISCLYASEVFTVINNGCNTAGIVISASPIDSDTLEHLRSLSLGKQAGSAAIVDFPKAHWSGAADGNYCGAQRSGNPPIDRVVIHTTEGSFPSAISWFQNPESKASAHYIVRSSNGWVVQMVKEKDVAYHAGNTRYNDRSVGIECEAISTDPIWFTSELYSSVSEIVKYVCNKYNLPKDRVTIIGHNQVPDPNDPTRWGGKSHHSDPRGLWNWSYFVNLVTEQAVLFTPLRVTAEPCTVFTEPGLCSPYLTELNTNQQFVSYAFTEPGLCPPYLTELNANQRFISDAQSDNSWYLVFLPGGNSLHSDGWIRSSKVMQEAEVTQLEVVWTPKLYVRPNTAETPPPIDTVSEGQRFVWAGHQGPGYDGATWYDYYLPQSSGTAIGWSSGAFLQLYEPPYLLPFIETKNAEVVTSQSAILCATVTSADTSTRVWFEYGPGLTYTLRTPHKNCPDGDSVGQVTAQVDGLESQTDYSFRIGCANPNDTIYGSGKRFTTLAKSSESGFIAEPSPYELNQNFPNPFNPNTLIQFRIPKTERVHLAIWDVLGREVVVLLDQVVSKGIKVIQWDGKDKSGNDLPSGLYFCRMSCQNFASSNKMLLVK